jgi:molybdopterin synthase catalytic subunit
MHNHFIVTQEILEFSRYISLVTEDQYGAVASFLGTVRSPNAGEVVQYIDYEGYEGMIKTQMQIVAEILRERYDLGHIVLAHRLGRLEPSDISIAIVISSKHRKEALLACHEGINLAKERLPVWKHEKTSAGATWVPGVTISRPL